MIHILHKKIIKENTYAQYCMYDLSLLVVTQVYDDNTFLDWALSSYTRLLILYASVSHTKFEVINEQCVTTAVPQMATWDSVKIFLALLKGANLQQS